MLDYVPGPYRAGLYAGVIIILMIIGFAGGWLVNGWRLSGVVEAREVEIVRMQGVIDLHDQAVKQMAKEYAESARVASAAQAEAKTLRKTAKAKAIAVMAMPASSCADVLRESWGRL